MASESLIQPDDVGQEASPRGRKHVKDETTDENGRSPVSKKHRVTNVADNNSLSVTGGDGASADGAGRTSTAPTIVRDDLMPVDNGIVVFGNNAIDRVISVGNTAIEKATSTGASVISSVQETLQSARFLLLGLYLCILLQYGAQHGYGESTLSFLLAHQLEEFIPFAVLIACFPHFGGGEDEGRLSDLDVMSPWERVPRNFDKKKQTRCNYSYVDPKNWFHLSPELNIRHFNMMADAIVILLIDALQCSEGSLSMEKLRVAFENICKEEFTGIASNDGLVPELFNNLHKDAAFKLRNMVFMALKFLDVNSTRSQFVFDLAHYCTHQRFSIVKGIDPKLRPLLSYYAQAKNPKMLSSTGSEFYFKYHSYPPLFPEAETVTTD